MQNFKFKKSFYNAMSEMTDRQAGEFIKGVCEYVFNGKPFHTNDKYLKGVYLYVKRELDVAAMNSANGRKGGLVTTEKNKTAAPEGVHVIAGEIIAENPLAGMINYLKRENEKQAETGGKVLHENRK